jgi:hypothetical protein
LSPESVISSLSVAMAKSGIGGKSPGSGVSRSLYRRARARIFDCIVGDRTPR